MSMMATGGLSIKHDVNPWLLWVIFFSSILVFISLWLITSPIWHIAISLFTIILLWFGSPSPLKTIGFILSLVVFLATLQLLFSPYMRQMFLQSLDQGFLWDEWQYLLFAIERLAWPLMLVSIFQSSLNNPIVAAHLTNLLAPLRWFGLRINKLQSLIMLALRFMPSLRREWDRLSYFQTYFSGRHVQKTLIQKISFAQGVLKALISHTIYRAVTTGNMLALRGLPESQTQTNSRNLILPGAGWIVMGAVFYSLNDMLAIVWLSMTLWMGLVAVSGKQST